MTQPDPNRPTPEQIAADFMAEMGFGVDSDADLDEAVAKAASAFLNNNLIFTQEENLPQVWKSFIWLVAGHVAAFMAHSDPRLAQLSDDQKGAVMLYAYYVAVAIFIAQMQNTRGTLRLPRT